MVVKIKTWQHAWRFIGLICLALSCPLAGCDKIGELAGDIPFEDNEDGTISDTDSGAMWQKADSGELLSWSGAIAYCENLELAGYDDWFLPDRDTLISLYKRLSVAAGGSENRMVLPFEWSSSPYWTSQDYEVDITFAWFMLFYSGNVYPSSKYNDYYARCIR